MKTFFSFLLILAASGCSTTLDVVNVSAPDVNCVFDSDCTITVDDLSDEFTLVGHSGSGFLQSRLFPPGEHGTPGAGLQAYLYRLDLRNMVGITNIACVTSLSIDFGPVAPLDYDGSGDPDEVFIVTQGGLGTVGPSRVTQSGSRLKFAFSPGVCAGASPGRGESSFFFGLASTRTPRAVQAEVRDSQGETYLLDARAPNL